MQEIFYEETAVVNDYANDKKKYNTLKTLSIICYVLVCLWVLFIVNFFDWAKGHIVINLIVVLLPFAILLMLGIVFGRNKNRYLVDFDYNFISGSIKVAKVFNNSSRRLVCKFDTTAIEKIGNFQSETYKRYSKMPGVKQVNLTSNKFPQNNKNFYYIVANVQAQKMLYIFECTQLFIKNILKFTSRLTLEDNFLIK